MMSRILEGRSRLFPGTMGDSAMTDLAKIMDRFSNVGNAAEKAYAVLREAILNDTLKPGTRLRADEIAKQIGVSKTPVREALRKLQAEDLVTVNPGNYLTVKVITEKQLLEIYYTREALEGMAARLAAGNAGQMELHELRAVLEDIELAYAERNLERLRRLSGDFQLALFRASRNDVLYRLIKGLQEQVRHYRGTTLSLPGRPDEMMKFCRELLEAIERRDQDSAERLARENRRRTLELRLKMLRNAARTAR
jgi:DNA-binding GntR family transcriptional regulator